MEKKWWGLKNEWYWFKERYLRGKYKYTNKNEFFGEKRRLALKELKMFIEYELLIGRNEPIEMQGLTNFEVKK